MKLGLVYSGEIRDNGTPVHFRYAFYELLGRENVEWYTPLRPIPAGCDFYIRLDDGLDNLHCAIPGPWGYYATDTHLGYDSRRDLAAQASIVWVAQKPAVNQLAKEGIRSTWVPLACNPFAHPTAEELAKRLEKKAEKPIYDIGFVGFLQDPEKSSRVSFLDELSRAFPNFRFAFGAFHEDMAAVYHQCRLGINHSVRDDLNMRFFELASMGVPQVADENMIGLSDLGFFPFTHYIPHSGDPKAAINRISDALQEWYQGDFLQVMAGAALTHVRAYHTYTNRAALMIKQIREENLCSAA